MKRAGSVKLVNNAQNLQVTKPNEEIDGVVTSYSGGNDAVRGLFIHSQTLNFFPAGIEKIFINLRAILIGQSKLKRITKANLKPFTELKGLWIYHNEIDTLEKDLFMFNTRLTYIYFISNKLQHIDNKILEPLTQLTTAVFSGNPCISIDAETPTKIQELKNQIAQGCQDAKVARKHSEAVGIEWNPETTTQKPVTAKLLENDLKKQVPCGAKDNQIDAIMASIHKMAQRISVLEDQNQMLMKKLGVESERKWKPKAKELELKCNMKEANKCDAVDWFVASDDVSISQVVDGKGNKVEATEIKEIVIDDQETFFLPTNFNQLFPKVEKLSVTNSRLLAIDNLKLGELKALKELNLRSNQLRFTTATDFESLGQLTELDLSFNRIADIENGAFDDLGSLEKLNLEDNLLTDFNFKLLAKTGSLKEINLQGNKLRSIKATSIDILNQFTSIDLSANPCIDSAFPKASTLAVMKQTIVGKCAPPLQLCCELEVDDDELTCR